MRVLLVSPLPPPVGGIATWTNGVLRYCEEKDVSCAVVNTAIIGKRRNNINGKRNLKDEIVRSHSIFSNFVKQVITFRPDIIHINSSCSKFGLIRDAVCVLVAKLKSKKVVFHCHCNVEDMLGKNRIYRYIFSSVIKKTEKVLVLNEESLKFVKKITSKEKCELVPNFISIKEDSMTREISKEIHKCTFLGYVHPHKGVKEIFTVAPKFPNMNFVLIGPIAEEVLYWNKPENVLLKGAMIHEHALQSLKESDVFVFPSYSEGFSIALLEAMSMGLPIIATDVGANKDMVEKNGGIIIAPKNADELEKGLLNIVDYKTRRKMSLWNINKVNKNYSMNVVCENLVSMYEELLKG